MRTNEKYQEIKAANETRKAVVSELLTLVVPQDIPEEEVINRTEAAEKAIAKVACKPWQEGFQDSDLRYHINTLRSNIEYNKNCIQDARRADEELIALQGNKLQGLNKVDRWRHPVMRDHKTLTRQIHSREAFMNRAYATIEVLETELNNRKERAASQRAELARKHEEWKEKHSKLFKAKSNKQKKLYKPAPKARNERTLKGFGELLTINRRKGIFATEVPIKKEQVIEKLGGIEILESALKEAQEGVIHTFNDGRKIIQKKVGAVVRYFELA